MTKEDIFLRAEQLTWTDLDWIVYLNTGRKPIAEAIPNAQQKPVNGAA